MGFYPILKMCTKKFQCATCLSIAHQCAHMRTLLVTLIINLNFFTSKIPAFAGNFYVPGLIAEKIRSYWPFLKNILHFHWSNSYSALIVKRVNLTNSSSLPHKVPSYFENWVMWFKGANFWKNEEQKIR